MISVTPTDNRAQRDRLPSQTLLAQLLEYDPLTGALTWKPRPASMFRAGMFGQDGNAQRWNTKRAGQPALAAKNGNGYCHGSLLEINVLAHRVIFKLLHGLEPDEVDHINGDRADNRAENLRPSTRGSNAKNCARTSRNTNGNPGVDRQNNLYRARVSNLNCGYFSTREAAIEARRLKLKELGYSDRHGEPR